MRYDVLLASVRKKGVEIPRTLLAFDPGETTGCCVFKDGKPSEFMQLPSVNKKTREYEWSIIEEFIDKVNPDAVIIENYRIYAHKLEQHSSSDVPTLQLIGVIKYMLHKRNIPYKLQMAQQAKGFVTDAKLKEWGMWDIGHKHARDACRHCVYYLVSLKPNKLHSKQEVK